MVNQNRCITNLKIRFLICILEKFVHNDAEMGLLNLQKFVMMGIPLTRMDAAQLAYKNLDLLVLLI